MPTSILHDLGTSFDDRAALLQVALGTISMMHRFRELLDRYAPIAEVATASSASRDDSTLDLLLGVVSVSQHLMRFVELARTRRISHPESSHPRVDGARHRRLNPRDLLEYSS